jgi:hypothetical protein
MAAALTYGPADMLSTPRPVAATDFDPWSGTRGAGAKQGFSVPLVVAVTGHRDLRPAEIPGIRGRIRALFAQLRDAHPHRPIMLMSALAEGADQLAAAEALDLGIALVAVLPMPRDLYAQDFTTPGSRAEFDRLCAAAADVFELALVADDEPPACAQGIDREAQYAQCGVFLCAHCQILLALWDGKPSAQVGGTSQVVHFHHHDFMPGYGAPASASRLTLTDDESDLVYHIVCSRDRPDGAPQQGLQPLEVSWFTTDERNPRTAEMPARHRRVFERSSEFGQDAALHAGEIEQGCYPLLTDSQVANLPPGLTDINRVFCAADWLAVYFQKRFMFTLRMSHACVFLTGLAYVSYTDFYSTRLFLFMVVALMLAASGINRVARRGAWHRKYLDYRTLAEGLRVQFYWAAAGVTSGSRTKFAHDNFLQMQDPELGWIRNVMRVAGTEYDARSGIDAAGLRFAIGEWIGDERSGQLGYFLRRTAERIHRRHTTHRIGRAGIWASTVTLAILMFVGAGVPNGVQNPLVYVMGCVLLAVGVRQSYAKATAEAELIKQYEFMVRIFHNARRRLDETDDDVARRGILKALGDAALEEHAQWILMHRERSVGQEDVVRLG